MAKKYYIVQKDYILDSADTWELALQVSRYHSSLSGLACHVVPQYWAERKLPAAVKAFEEKQPVEKSRE